MVVWAGWPGELAGLAGPPGLSELAGMAELAVLAGWSVRLADQEMQCR